MEDNFKMLQSNAASCCNEKKVEQNKPRKINSLKAALQDVWLVNLSVCHLGSQSGLPQ
jgi:hypothetical protein